MFTLPDLPYPYNALEPFIDEQTMRIHHDKHHATYTKNLNDVLTTDKTIEEVLKNLATIPDATRTKVRNNGGGYYNHSLFWSNMAPPSGQVPEGKFRDALISTFGSVESFQEKFTSAGLNRFGSGWVWLVSDKGVLRIMDTPNQDSPIMEQQTPILCLDVWEHAYYLKYQNLRADYIKAWWHVVNWREVEKRYAP